MNKLTITSIIGLIALAASCSSDPKWDDPEAHEKTEQLRKQYTPFVLGTWHYEYIGEKQRFFERLTFEEDGTMTGYRKWETRTQVTVDGEELFTEWESKDYLVGSFTGTWRLEWVRDANGTGTDRMYICARFDEDANGYLAFCRDAHFDYADTNTLRFMGHWFERDGWSDYKRGDAEPSF